MTTGAAPAGHRSGTATVGRILLTVALIATPTALAVFLLNDDHALNPRWHPHARFHGVQLAGFGITLSLLVLWLVWRRAREPVISALTARGDHVPAVGRRVLRRIGLRNRSSS